MTNKMTLSEELKWRGLVNQTTIKDLKYLDENKLTFYHGFDASSDSQTIGNLAAMMVDLCFLRHGHKAIVLAGGATSLVGDPGGKDKERPLQTVDTIAHNVECAKKQLNKIYKGHEYLLVNNIDWTRGVDILDFLRDVGKYFNVGEMIKKEYIAARLGEGGAGISYTEFSYELLQGFDFLHLFEKYNCTLQIGGADQWTNCLAGVELIRKKLAKESHVITLPLIINKATGKKFGKSEAGAVWLDSAKTSVFDFYNFWINTDDDSCKDYVKIYTDIQPDEYEKLVEGAKVDGSKRLVQKYLAYSVTKLVHGEDEANKARETAESLFGGEKMNLNNLETFELENGLDGYDVQYLNLVEFMPLKGIVKSKREAREMLESGAIYINDEKYSEEVLDVSKIKLSNESRKEFLLRVGKKKYYRIVF
jgi:tyrosyl-tRNA synthetase